jgi:FMN reductase
VEGALVSLVDIRDLPPADLLHARADSPALSPIVADIARATGIIVGTPVYKAAYSGVLKVFLDLLPANALAGKTVLPLAMGGTPLHALSLDYALKPVLMALGAESILRGLFLLDKQLTATETGIAFDAEAEPRVASALAEFSRALART